MTLFSAFGKIRNCCQRNQNWMKKILLWNDILTAAFETPNFIKCSASLIKGAMYIHITWWFGAESCLAKLLTVVYTYIFNPRIHMSLLMSVMLQSQWLEFLPPIFIHICLLCFFLKKTYYIWAHSTVYSLSHFQCHDQKSMSSEFHHDPSRCQVFSKGSQWGGQFFWSPFLLDFNKIWLDIRNPHQGKSEWRECFLHTPQCFVHSL